MAGGCRWPGGSRFTESSNLGLSTRFDDLSGRNIACCVHIRVGRVSTPYAPEQRFKLSFPRSLISEHTHPTSELALLQGQVPHKPSITTMPDQHSFLAGGRAQAIPMRHSYAA